MTNKEFVAKLKDIATNYNTIYMWGVFGAPVTESVIARKSEQYPTWYTSAKQKTFRNLIGKNYFGFDCVCLIKAILWGWDGNASDSHGGAKYASNGVPDIGADTMITKCSGVSTDFSKIEIGEAVWIKGHIGVYIGNGLAIECTPSWDNKVQITACNCSKSGYNRRNWTKHGKLPYITYVDTENAVSKATVKEWQEAAIKDGYEFPKYGADGVWGPECESVAKKAIVKRRLRYTNKNLTKIVQKAVGVTVDGLCGKKTDAAIREYQKKHYLAVDGEVGINTWEKILNIK